jgi:hypothetical protein
MQSPNFAYEVVGKLCVISVLSPRHLLGMKPRARAVASRVASLARTVVHVVLMRAQKEVFWVDTTGVVAAVAYEQAIGDRPIGEYIGDSVRHSVLPIAIKQPIAAVVLLGCRPHQAIANPLRLLPKALVSVF